jgi:hypothetical protein
MKNSIMGALILVALNKCTSVPDSESPFSIQENSQGLELYENGKPILFYQNALKSLDSGKYARNNYIHPLYSLQGDILTEDFPEDHPHHRGIFWAWHQIHAGDSAISDGWALENFVSTIKDVRTEVHPQHAVINILAEWSSPVFNNQQPYLEENTNYTVHRLQNNVRLIDMEISLQAKIDSLHIGGSNDEKGYGGLSIRIKMPDDLIFRGKEGKVTPENLQVDAGPWMDFTASFGTNETGVTLFCHPGTPGYSQKWILRQQSSMQNVVFPGQHAVHIPNDRPLVLKYRLMIHNGLSIEEINSFEEEYNQQAIDLSEGLVAHYPFDGSVQNGDNINERQTTLEVDRFENENGAYGFNGSGSMVWAAVSDFPELNTPQSFSWWFYQDKPQTYKDSLDAGNMIVLVDSVKGTGIQFGFRGPGYHTLGLDTWQWGGGAVLEVEIPKSGEWHHCVYTFDGNTHRLYINSREAATSKVKMNDGAPSLLMFGNYPGGDQYFGGKLDEVRIYDRALSSVEITALYELR